MKKLLFSSFLVFFILLSCNKRNESSIITIRLSKTDYLDKILIPGTIQAVVNFPVVPPRTMTGQLTVARLAQDGEYVHKGDTICVLSAPDLKSMYENMVTGIERLEAEYTKTEADNNLNLALLEAQLATSEARMKISSLDSAQMKYAPELRQKIIALEIERSVIEKRKTEKKLKATKSINDATLRQLRARMISEKARAQTINDQINSLTIIAQRDGIVTRTESPRFMIMGPQGLGSLGGPIKEGSVLFIGTPVLQFPDLSRMQLSAEVGEADFKKIEKGQKALIQVNSAEKIITTGKVNRKSLMGRQVQRYSDSKVKTYEVIIDIDSCHNRMKPGLSADCWITLREAADTVYVPTMAIFERDSSKVVYVKEDGKFRAAKISTGDAGSSHTIITSGLKGDEEIALTEPPSHLVYKTVEIKNETDTLNSKNGKKH